MLTKLPPLPSKTNSSNQGKSFMPRGRTADNQTRVLIDKFVRMLPGQSFFIADVERADVEFLRRPVVKLGVGISIHEVDVDEIYQQRGVRIWREEGAFDEL